MPFSTDEQRLYDHARASLPRFLWQKVTASASSEAIWGGFVKIFDAARATIEQWFKNTLITQSEGYWVDQHLADRGMARQEGESDAAAAERCRTVEDAVTEPFLKAGVDAILAAEGLGASAFVTVRQERAFFGTYVGMGVVDGLSAPAAGTQTLTDNERNFNWKDLGRQVTVSGAANPTNNGTFTVTSVPAWNQVSYSNPSGIAELDGAAWQLVAQRRAYVGRGYRIGFSGRPMQFIVILPYGTSAATRAAVDAFITLKKAAGFKHSIEVRGVP